MISNASPLIMLSKINHLELLRRLYGKIIIPEEVRTEVLYKEKVESELIERALQEQWILIKNPVHKISLHLGKGETAAISLAKEENDEILLDDGQAVKAARIYGIEIFRTTSVLFLAKKKGILTTAKTIQLLNKLLQEGYYLKPALYAQLLEKLR